MDVYNQTNAYILKGIIVAVTTGTHSDQFGLDSIAKHNIIEAKFAIVDEILT